jgi:hypothetical protein
MTLLGAGPLFAQQPAYRPDPHLNPDDQFAPSQIVQPMPTPVPVPEPGAAAPRAKTKTNTKPIAKLPHPVRRVETTKPVPNGPPAKRERPERYRTVVECSGPFAKDSGMLALAVAYDSRNMVFKEETVQGTSVGATVLFPKDPRRRLEVWWSNPNRTGTYLIDIAGKSIWTAPEGLRLGLTLEQLQKINGKPFKLKGFDSDDVAAVADWDGGALATLPGGCKAGVSLHAKANAAKQLPAADQYSSEDPVMRAIKPTVSEILIGY